MKSNDIDQILNMDKNLPRFQNRAHREALEREVIAAAARRTADGAMRPAPALEGHGRGLLMRVIRERWAALSAGAATLALALAALAFLLIGSPRQSLAKAIEQSLESALATSFHAMTYACRGDKAVPIGEICYGDGRLAQYSKDNLVLYNDGQRTWLLNRQPALIRSQTVADVLASQAGLKDLATELQSSRSNASGKGLRMNVYQEPDETLEGKPVAVWKVEYIAGDKPYHLRELRADRATGRIVEVSEWENDWSQRSSTSQLLLSEIMNIVYDEPVEALKLAIALPGPGEARDLTAAQARFDRPGVMVVYRPEVSIELRNLMIGPRGEVVACIVYRAPDQSQPPYGTFHLSSGVCAEYELSLLNVNYETPGLRLTWAAWFPPDLDSYLAGSAKGPDWRGRLYTMTWNTVGTEPEVRETVSFQVQEEFTEADFEELVSDAVWASGFTRSTWKSFAEFEERTAFAAAAMASTRLDLGMPEQPEDFVRWLSRYGELAQANGDVKDALSWLKGPFLRAIEDGGDGKEGGNYRLLTRTRELAESAWKEGRRLELDDVRQAVPECFADPSVNDISAIATP